MSKNIVLCSDGTGNKGGYGSDTNVFKLYKAIDIHSDSKKQIVYYDDGVGTNKNKYIRAISGALGFGFRQNVRDLYEYLSRNYCKGKATTEFGLPSEPDDIYLFGFSRGAATARAFAGLIGKCGILDRSKCVFGDVFDEDEFQKKISQAMEAYRLSKSHPEIAENYKENNSVNGKQPVPIKFIGVWDTVSALGFPQDWSWVVNWLFWSLDRFTDILPKFSHHFYDYQLGRDVEYAYHAVAIDDERKTFHPILWDEITSNRPKNIEQVWFAGVHSNVGGGYPRSGLADVTFDWMLKRAIHNGLYFKAGFTTKIEKRVNPYGKLFNSRDGAAIYYRYSPRNIEALAKGKIVEENLLIHRSVFERMDLKSADYAPAFLPQTIRMSDSTIGAIPIQLAINYGRASIDRSIAARKVLYRVFVEFSIFVLIAAGILWKTEYDISKNVSPHFIFEDVSEILRYFSPEYFDGIIAYTVLYRPEALGAIILLIFAMYFLKKFFRANSQRACEMARRAVMSVVKPEL